MLRRFKSGLSGARGDTIVEVMVVLAVLGLAIGISYATANRSLLDARQAQENAQATELAQAQIEALRTLGSAANAAVPATNIFRAGPYCTYYDASSNSYKVKFPIGSPPAAVCTSGLYNISVTGPPSPLTGGTFTVTVTWPDVEGQGNDTVTLVYRLYQQ